MGRSRTAWSPVLRYSCHSDCVSSGFVATVRGYGLEPSFPAPERSPWTQRAERERREPQGERRRGKCDHDKSRLAPGGIRSRRGDTGERQRKHEKERAERAPLCRRSQGGKGCRKPRRYNSCLEPPRGVAQLAEHRSPKTGGAGSSPAAPVEKRPASARL